MGAMLGIESWRGSTIYVVRLEQPSRRILVEILVPLRPVTTEAAPAKEPEGDPQPQ
jgi:hypothetical protein